MRMSWETEAEHDATERKIGATEERERIRKAQVGALRNLRVLLMPECLNEANPDDDEGCTARRHIEDCPKGLMLEQLRWLRAATRRTR